MSIEERIFELLMESGTNWTAVKKPTFSEEGWPSGHYGIYRSDNNKPIGAVGERYAPMQNAELADHVVRASEGITANFSGGLFKGGSRVYYQAKLKDVGVANDIVKRTITAMNSHDGSSSIGFGFANTVISCQNTFYRALKEVEKFRHTESASERLERVREELQYALTHEGELIENYKRMADTKLTVGVQKKVIADLFNLEVEDLSKEIDSVSTRKLNRMKEFNTAMEKELAQKGETLWGMFNAVTFKTNHLDPKPEKSLESIFLGAGATKNLRAYNTLVKSLPLVHSLS